MIPIVPKTEGFKSINMVLVGSGGKTTFRDTFLETQHLESGKKIVEVGKNVLIRLTSKLEKPVELERIGFIVGPAKNSNKPHDGVGLIVCNLTQADRLQKIDYLAEQLRKHNFKEIYILATHADEPRTVSSEQLNEKISSLNLNGVIEVNGTDKSSVDAAIKKIALSHLENKVEAVMTEIKAVVLPKRTFWSWLLDLFTCFGIFTKTVDPKKAPPDVKNF